MDKGLSDVSVIADYAFVTNQYILFVSFGQCDGWISYAIDSKGNELKIDSDSYQMHDIRVEWKNGNANVVATGNDCMKAVNSEDDTTQKLFITYKNNTITVSPNQ
jgi:hypothetical protein